MPNLITLDFETYYDKEYGLKKYTTEEYIRDEKFEVIDDTQQPPPENPEEEEFEIVDNDATKPTVARSSKNIVVAQADNKKK